MSADEQGNLLLGRLSACEKAALFASGATQRVLEAAAQKTVDLGLPDWSHVLEALAQVDDGYAASQCTQAFARTHPSGFDLCRVVTRVDYEHFYCKKLSPHATDTRLPIRDPEFALSSGLDATKPATLAPELKLQVTLGRVGAPHFATCAADWDQVSKSTNNDLATVAAQWLALPFERDTHLVMLRATADAGHAWDTCRRPNLLDAHDCAWWHCWPDDPAHHGHTIALSILLQGRLERGAKEWVLLPNQIETANGAVKAQELGPTTAGTRPGDVGDAAVKHFRSALPQV